jgi:type VI secretion system ImpB/VipA family protein
MNLNQTRVDLTLEDRTKDMPETKALAGKIMVIMALGGNTPTHPQSAPFSITKESFSTLPARIQPTLSFEVPDRISGDPDSLLSVNLTFTEGPRQFVQQTVQQVEALRLLDQKRRDLLALKRRVRSDAQLARRLKSLLKGDTADLRRLLAAAVG